MTFRATVVYSPGPRQVREYAVTLQQGATLRDAVAKCGLLDEFAQLDLKQHTVGIWGRKATPGQRLRADDRVEIYRPLLVDPKVARRERFTRQGARGTGLFAKRRAGAKAGY